MDFKKRASNPYGYRGAEHLRRLVGLISNFQRDTDKSRTKQNDHSSEDNALVKYTRRLGRATWVIAMVGVLAFGASLLQWDALRRSDETTRESFTAVQRPFVSAKDLKIELTYAGRLWEFAVLVENSGGTPTKEMVSVTDTSYQEPPGDPEEVYARTPIYPYTVPPAPPPQRWYSYLGPKAESILPGSWSGQQIIPISRMADNRGHFYILGSIHYHDQFKETAEHVTKFCFAAIPFRVGNVSNDVQVRGERCLYWNCADEDCKADRERWDHDVKVYREELRKAPKVLPQPSDQPVSPKP